MFRDKYFKALTILARVWGCVFIIVGVLGALLSVSGGPGHVAVAPFVAMLFAVIVGVALLLAKPITAEAVEKFFGRRG